MLTFIIIFNYKKMSTRGSPIRGLEPNVKQFTLQSYALNTENQRLTQLVLSKNNQIKALMETNAKTKNTYEAQANAFRRTIQSLEKQINENEKSREEDYQTIKKKYDQLSSDQVSELKSSHTNEIEFLFKEITQLRASINTYDSKIDLKDHQILCLRESYERELALNTKEINTLSKKIIQLDEDKAKEIKDLTNKRELERSRTSGIVNSKKQSNQYIEKQLRKLNEDILEKTIGIENVTRKLNKEKKKLEDTTKAYEKKIEDISEDYEEQLKEKDEHFAKIQKLLKDEILEYKEKQIKLLEENQTLKSNNNILKKDIEGKDAVIKAKTEQVFNLKANLEKMREDHINEINNLMKERKKRSSRSNLGSSRSLTSSLRESVKDGGQGTPAGTASPEHNELDKKLAGILPIVKEESSPERKDLSRQFSKSNILEEQNEDELARAIFHYDTLIEELKKSHEMELQHYKLTVDKTNSRLKQKESELQDVLTRFQPLVKIHAEQKSLEEDRKERIERHWKADIGILQIMLNKYKIRSF